MITLKPSDAKHKAMMYRLLISLIDDSTISSKIAFKGGTCASMLGYLDRFSVDLDFDLLDLEEKPKLRTRLTKMFADLGFTIKDESQNALQFYLKYESKAEERNTLKLEITDILYQNSNYEIKYLSDIDRYAKVQTIETMFANKLVAITDRFKIHSGQIAGRDLYDIHYFFFKGYNYNSLLIEERTSLSVKEYFKELIEFINQNITSTIIDQDLNFLLTPEKFKSIRKTLKDEVLFFLKNKVRSL